MDGEETKEEAKVFMGGRMLGSGGGTDGDVVRVGGDAKAVSMANVLCR